MKKIINQKSLLQELANSNKVLVTGSYAKGNQTECSDIDFKVRIPQATIIYDENNKNLEWIKELLAKYSIKWHSTEVGYITTVKEENGPIIPMEFYEYFDKVKNKLPEVEIMRVKFKTY
jgi:predicted nucleotidyltransferase